MMLKNRLFVVIFTMFCCNLFCLSLSKAGSLKSIKNIFGKQQSCLSSDLFKAEWDCNGSSFKTKLCAFGENKKISLIYSIIDDLNECVNTKGNCTNVSTKITALKTEFGNSLPDNVRTCLGISGKETGIETLNNINDDVSSSNIDNYKNDIQKLYKYKYCLEGSETSETTDDILYADSDIKEKEGFLLLLYKQLYYELTAINNLVNIDEDKNHENYEYAKNQILVIVDRILYKENNQDSQGLLDIYAELDKINTTDYTNILTNIKDNKGGNLSNITKINEFRNTIKGQIASLEKAKISDCSNGGAISERDNNLENKYCNNGTNIVKQKYAKINSLMDELEVLKVTPIESEENVNNNIYHIESYITVMQNGINDIKTEIKDLKNLVNRYSSDLMMDVNACFNQYISIDTIIKNFDKLDFYFNADNNANSLVKYYRYLKELNAQFGGSALYTKDDVNTAYTKFEKKIKIMLNPQEFYVNFLNYNSSFINLIRGEENKAAEIFRQELFSEEVKAVVYDNAIIETMCYIMDLITGNIGRSIMALSLIITAFMWLQGKIEPKELFSFVLAISIMYGSLSIANLIAKNNYSCGFAKSLEYIERTGSVDKCEDGFIWSISANKCVAKSCYNPTMKNVIFYSDYAFYKGNSVLGECTNGYEGKVNAKCIFADDELSWEYTGGCEKIYCYIQPSYDGVEFNTKDDKNREITTFDYRAKVSGKCKTGYKGNGYTATCTGKNKWSYSGSCQAIYCPALSRATDGTTKQASWPATKANSVGYGTCFSPYVNTYFADLDLNPNHSRSVSFAFCDENGQWDFQKKNNPTLLEKIYKATTKAERDANKKEFQDTNNNSKYSKYLCEISRCEAINIADSKTGNAIWPESDIGDENIIGICGKGYYYNNGTEKTIYNVVTYDLKNQYLTEDEQNEIDKYFNKDLKDIIAGLDESKQKQIKDGYKLKFVDELTDEEKNEIIRTLKIEKVKKYLTKDEQNEINKYFNNDLKDIIAGLDENRKKQIKDDYKLKFLEDLTDDEKNAIKEEYKLKDIDDVAKLDDEKKKEIKIKYNLNEVEDLTDEEKNEIIRTLKIEKVKKYLTKDEQNEINKYFNNDLKDIIAGLDENRKKQIKDDYKLKFLEDLTDDEKDEIIRTLKIEKITAKMQSKTYYGNDIVKMNSDKIYDLSSKYLSEDELTKKGKYFKNNLEAILAGLTDAEKAEINSSYNLKDIENLTKTQKNVIMNDIKAKKAKEIANELQSKGAPIIFGKCEASGEIITNDNKACYIRKCPAITMGDKNSNYATWPTTDALTLVESSKDSDCISGYSGSHSAYCDEFGTWHFDSYNNGYRTIKLESCMLSVCNKDITLSLTDDNGFSIISFWDNKIKWNVKAKIKSDYALKSINDLTDDEKNAIKEEYKLNDINDIVNLDDEKKNEIKVEYDLKDCEDLTDEEKNEILGSLKIEDFKDKDLTAIITSLTDKKIAEIKNDYGLEEIKELSEKLSDEEKNKILRSLKIDDFKDKDLTPVIKSLVDEKSVTIPSIDKLDDRKQGQDIKVYCADNSEVHNYVGKNESFEKDDNGVSYITATCSKKNNWITNGKCVYKPCEAIAEADVNASTGWAYFEKKFYPELDSGWTGKCHSYFANDDKTLNNILLNKELKNCEDLKGRVLSFSDIVGSLRVGQVVSGDDVSCKFDKDKNKSVLGIAKNQCKVPVIFADLYKAEGVLKFFDVGEQIGCTKKNFDFKADADDNSFVCIMFTDAENNYDYTGKRVNKSYKILAVEGETIIPGAISNITEFENEMFNKAKTCHPVTVEMDIDKSTEHFSFGSDVKKYIYKNKEVSYQDSGLIKDKTKTAIYPNACEEGYVGNPVVKCGNKGIWEPTENKCEHGCYISDLVNDITTGNFQNDFNKIDTNNLFTDTNENGKFETKLDFIKTIFVYDGTYLKIPLNGCRDGYAGIPIVKCEGSKWKWKMKESINNYCQEVACYFSTYANAEGTSGWKILNDLNDFSNTRSNAIVKNKEYMIADCNDGMVSNKDNKFTDSTVSSIEQQKHIIAQCKNGTIKPYDENSGTACVSGCIYGDKTKGWNDSMFSGADANSAYSIFKEIGGTAGSFSVRNSENSVVQKECKTNYSIAEVKKDGYSCNPSLSTQPVLQCENGEWKQYDTGADDNEGKHCYTCGIVVQYYSPRDGDTLFKEKVLKEGDTVVCDSNSFGGDPDPDVKKLCRIKGSDKYFGYEDDGKTYKVGDDLFEAKSSACHIAYVSKDINSIFLSDYTKAGGETKLHNGKNVYSNDAENGKNNYGLRQNGEKYIIRCAGGYAGAPEIVCDNGTWSWKPTENTDNYCYLNGCDLSKETDGRNLANTGWGLETDDCTTSSCVSGGNTARKIIPEGSWASAKCADGFVSNIDNPTIDNNTLIARQKYIFGKCVKNSFEYSANKGGKTTGEILKFGDKCVRGCVYKDTSMGWTDETFKNTVPDTDKKYGGYKMYEKDTDATIGTYALRLGSKSVNLYKYCKNSGDIEVTEKEVYKSAADLANGIQSTVTFTGHMNDDYGPYDSIGSVYYTQRGDDVAYYYKDGTLKETFYKDTIEVPLIKCNYDTGKWEASKSSSGKTFYTGCELSGCTDFAFHASDHIFTVPSEGLKNVKMQVWGAQGGNSGGLGGSGGYGYGKLLSIVGDTKITVTVGQWGGYNKVKANAFGAGYGGAIDGDGCGGSRGKGGNGGGGTKISFGNVILQAGGGGGAGEYDGYDGGYGGGANENGGRGAGSGGGYPGTLTAAGKATNSARTDSGSGSNGGNARDNDTNNSKDKSTSKGNWCGGGGGGGYYGGAAGEWGKSVYGAGGGGSGYAVGFDKDVVIGEHNIKTGNGFARICWGGNENCNTDGAAPTKSVCGTRYSNKFSNAVEVHYGEGDCGKDCWKAGYFRYGFTGSCANNVGQNFDGNWGDPRVNKTKSCMSPGGFFQYADENGTFTAL